MALGTSVQVNHKFVSGKADGADGTFVQPSKWNQAANFSAGSDGQILVRDSTATEGASWVDAGAAYGVRGLVGANNATTPNTKYDLSADLVVLRDPTLKYAQAKANTGTITNDTGLAGPAANGRDQAGAFGASTWIHFYFIAKTDGTLATLSSIVAPPTGPTLPTGYTMWAYATSVRNNATPILVFTYTRGSYVTPAAPRNSTDQLALSAGAATVETSVSLTQFAPPNALVIDLATDIAALGTAFRLRVKTTLDYDVISATILNKPVRIPNVGQNFFYLFDAAGGNASVFVKGFAIPNGGE